MKVSNVMRWSVVGVAMAVAAALYAPMAAAHGEKSQAPGPVNRPKFLFSNAKRDRE
ncbi:MAG: hypothetical protein ACREYC_09270 [Gammaproteobacteria bacterium]